MIRIFLLFLMMSACNSDGDEDPQQTSTPTSDDRTVASADGTVDETITDNALSSSKQETDTEKTCQSPQPFKSLWKVDADDKITLPLPQGTGTYKYKFTVDWGDGTTAKVTSYDDPDASHTYEVASAEAEGEGVHEGNYRVTITGLLEAWNFAGKNCDKLVAIEDLGNTCLKSLNNAFRDCKKLTQVKGGNTSKVTDMSYAFYRAGEAGGSLKLHINSWDTSKVISMEQMFCSTEGLSFECDEGDDCDDEANLKNWQTANVSNMSMMFRNQSTVNPDVSNWRTDSLTNVQMMFHQPTENSRSIANPDVSNWNFSNIKKFKDFISNSAIDDDNYCNLIIALGTTPPSEDRILKTDGHKSISMSGTDCASHENFCQAKQALTDDGWTVTDATECPSQ